MVRQSVQNAVLIHAQRQFAIKQEKLVPVNWHLMAARAAITRG